MDPIFIKNMVCPRCIMAVEKSLQLLHIPYKNVELGKVQLEKNLDRSTQEKWEKELSLLGFTILRNKEVQKIESIKNMLLELFHRDEIPSSIHLSEYITQKIPGDYSKLSYLFSSWESITIEKYFIHLKVEKVKEWLSYEEYNLSEAAWKLGYSSVQHLSSQFKKVTGMTPSEYKKMREKPRVFLDEINGKSS